MAWQGFMSVVKYMSLLGVYTGRSKILLAGLDNCFWWPLNPKCELQEKSKKFPSEASRALHPPVGPGLLH